MERRSMDCDRVEGEDLVEGYLTGKLGESEREEFEAHCARCPACLERLEIVRTVQAELWEQSRPTVPQIAEDRRRRYGRWIYAVAAAGLMMALGLALLWRFPSLRGKSVGSAESAADLSGLAGFEPPAYLPPPAPRGAPGEAGERFLRGMEFYQEGRYGLAILDLESAVGIDPQAANARFFLGICFLLTGKDNRGIDELRKSIGLRDPAYLEEAHFYLGKAYLRQKKTRSAKREFQAVVEAGGRLTEEAARLIRRLE
jgi:tetratricopeptide (TPR) repeat protein